jgi:hypothetical protein
MDGKCRTLGALFLALLFVVTAASRAQDRRMIPPDLDSVLSLWNSEAKYYLVIAANKYSVPSSDLAAVELDSPLLTDALGGIGYQKLGVGLITGEQATRNAIVNALGEVSKQGLTPQSKVLIYYAGHGATEPDSKDLWLQLFGEAPLGPHHGISLSEIVSIIRRDGYQGDLALIIDACFSGVGVVTGALTLKDLGPGQTTIITSASDIQPSYPARVPGTIMSAFSYLFVHGLTDKWNELDADGDGLVSSVELRQYEELGLKNLYKQGDIDALMTPFAVSVPREMLIAYKRDGIRDWDSPYRRIFASVKISLTNDLGTAADADLQKLRNAVSSIDIVSASGQVLAAAKVALAENAVEPRAQVTTLVFQTFGQEPVSVRFLNKEKKEIANKKINFNQTPDMKVTLAATGLDLGILRSSVGKLDANIETVVPKTRTYLVGKPPKRWYLASPRID